MPTQGYNEYSGMDWTGGDWGSQGWADSARSSYQKYLDEQLASASPGITGRGAQYVNNQSKAKRLNTFLDRALAWSKLQNQARDETLRGFRDYTEAGVGRSLGAANRSAALRNQRQGLGRSGLAGRAAAMSEVALRGQADAAQQDAGIELSKQMMGEQAGFMMQQSQYLNTLDLQNNQGRLNMQLAQFQAKLQRDSESRGAFYSMAGAIGQALPLLAAAYFPPAALAAPALRM